MSVATPADISAEAFGTCPLPIGNYDRILLGHGSGGTLSNDLIRKLFIPGFGGEVLAAMEDQATLEFPISNLKSEISNLKSEISNRLAFTTDSFVVRPIFFPGGDVGKLAVHGTVNDLAVGGANLCSSRPRSFSKKVWRWKI